MYSNVVLDWDVVLIGDEYECVLTYMPLIADEHVKAKRMYDLKDAVIPF